MEGYLGGAYPWVKSFHLISVIFWMAGMFMMPRFFAYHAEENATHGVGSSVDLTWRERERRLMRIIINPAMILAWILGLMLAFDIGWSGGWLHAKVAIVLLLSAYHGILSKWRKQFAAGNNPRGTKFYRIINELPTLAVVVIVILVIVKPF